MRNENRMKNRNEGGGDKEGNPDHTHPPVLSPRQVFVGARLHLVWALDTCLRVYVRQAIFPELPVGLSWVLVPGLAATHLSIRSGALYC